MADRTGAPASSGVDVVRNVRPPLRQFAQDTHSEPVAVRVGGDEHARRRSQEAGLGRRRAALRDAHATGRPGAHAAIGRRPGMRRVKAVRHDLRRIAEDVVHPMQVGREATNGCGVGVSIVAVESRPRIRVLRAESRIARIEHPATRCVAGCPCLHLAKTRPGGILPLRFRRNPVDMPGLPGEPLDIAVVVGGAEADRRMA